MLAERFQKLKPALSARQTDLTVVMENVHKPHNMAAILRSCEAVGIHQAHIVTAEGLSFRRPKAAAGVLRWVELIQHEKQKQVIEQLRRKGMRIIAAHPDDKSIHYRDYDYSQPTAIIFGSESTGLSDYAINHADELVSIPMRGLVRPLNVSVSAALILFEAQRQRDDKGCCHSISLDEETFSNTLFEWSWPRIARLCQSKSLPYPTIDIETGQITDVQGFMKLIS